MMRLIKLAAYALLGYALYEFVRGMLDESEESESTGGAIFPAAERRPGIL